MASMQRTIIRDNRRKVAVAYARFSSNNQREESIDAQLRAIREYCERENIFYETLLFDGLHPNDDGYRIMYELLVKELGV